MNSSRQTQFKTLFIAGKGRTPSNPQKSVCNGAGGFCRGTLRTVAFNSLALGSAVGLASNASVGEMTPGAASDWLMLAPYHEGPYHLPANPATGAPARTLKQVFQKPQADKMVAAFNALATKKGASFPGLPIYAGHPDCDPLRWPDERRLGGVVNLAARPDGLYIKAAWNDLGQQNLAQRYLVYPSPAWLYSTDEAERTGRIVPDELRSVGLTNSPRIGDVRPWTNCVPGDGAVGPGFRRAATNTRLDEGTLHPVLAASSPAGGGQSKKGDGPDLSSPEGRRRAFNQRLDELQKPPSTGGRALTLEEAIAEMRSNPGDAALLSAMGGR